MEVKTDENFKKKVSELEAHVGKLAMKVIILGDKVDECETKLESPKSKKKINQIEEIKDIPLLRRQESCGVEATQVTIKPIRPLKVIAFTFCFITVILMMVATSTSDWMLAEGWREGLFMQCIYEGARTPLPFGMQGLWPGCFAARSASYLRGAAALVIIGLIFDFFGTFLTGLGLRSTDPNKKYKYYRVAIYALIAALVALLLAAIIYPVQFSKDLANEPPKDGGCVQPVGDLDFDDDGIIDKIDNDDDNDGVPDDIDNDDDNDGIKDAKDPDDDNDGILDEDDNLDDEDFDGDGMENDEDPDDDNDGIPDEMEVDADDDGIPDVIDPDDDNDGDVDDDDDFDNDGIPDEEDEDDDNDGIDDDEDNDDDNDGIEDDVDDDNEGGDIDTDGDNIPDSEDMDDDGDNVPDHLDSDEDNDGVDDDG